MKKTLVFLVLNLLLVFSSVVGQTLDGSLGGFVPGGSHDKTDRMVFSFDVNLYSSVSGYQDYYPPNGTTEFDCDQFVYAYYEVSGYTVQDGNTIVDCRAYLQWSEIGEDDWTTALSFDYYYFGPADEGGIVWMYAEIDPPQNETCPRPECAGFEWRVRIRAEDVYGGDTIFQESPLFHFQSDQGQPDTPNIPVLSPNPACSGENVTASWNSVDGASWYNLFRNGNQIWHGTSTSHSFLASVGTYTVEAGNDCGTSSVSGGRSLTLFPALGMPPAPTIDPNPACSGENVTVTWSSLSGATHYYLYLDGNQIWDGAGTTTSVPASAGNYALRAENTCGLGPQGPGMYLNITPQVGQAGQPVFSENPACEGISTLVNWSAATNATSYTLFREGVTVWSGVGLSTTIDPVAGDYWVIGSNECGPGAQGGTGALTVNSVPIVTTAPFFSPDPVCLGDELIIQWAPINGATSYSLYQDDVLVQAEIPGTTFTVPASSSSFSVTAINDCGESLQGPGAVPAVLDSPDIPQVPTASTMAPMPDEAYTVFWSEVIGETSVLLENGTMVASEGFSYSTSHSSGTYLYQVINSNDCGDSDLSPTLLIQIAPLPSFTISGRVSDDGGMGIPGVQITGLPGSPATDGTGQYMVDVSQGFTGTAIPVLDNYEFIPQSINYADVQSDQFDQNYIGTSGPACTDPVCFNFTSNTSGNYSIIVNGLDMQGVPISECDEIGVFDGDLCVGAAVYRGTWPLGVVAWEDDSQTGEIDGYTTGHPITFKLARSSDCQKSNLCPDDNGWIMGDGTFGEDFASQVGLTDGCCREATINLSAGWNTISVNTIPTDLDIMTFLSPIVDDINLVKQCDGAFAIPGIINTLDPWDIRSSYWLHMDIARTLDYCGEPAATETVIPLGTGWNCVGYLCTEEIDVVAALTNIEPCLSIFKAPDGSFYIPGIINTIGNLKPGEGYLAHMQCDADLVYPCGTAIAEVSKNSSRLQEVSHHFHGPIESQNFHAVVVKGDGNLEIGDEVGLFTEDGLLVGSAVFQGSDMALAAWEDNSQTESVDGFRPGDIMLIRVWSVDSQTEKAVAIQAEAGSLAFGETDYTVVQLVEDSPKVLSIQLSCSPNPFNPSTKIYFAQPTPGHVRLCIYNPAGRLVRTLVDEFRASGPQEAVWDGRDSRGAHVASGVYLYRIQANGEALMRKMVLTK